MDEPQSEKLSGATGQLRTPRPIYSPAPFVLQDAGGFCTLGKREGESHLSSARSSMNVFTCYCVTARDGSREHRHDNLEWRKKLSQDANVTRTIHILCVRDATKRFSRREGSESKRFLLSVANYGDIVVN